MASTLKGTLFRSKRTRNQPIFFYLLAAVLITQLALPSRVAAQSTGEAVADWQPVAPGIDYRLFVLTSPVVNRVHVARMDRSNAALTLESSLANGRLSGGTERVSGMFQRYDQALSYWHEEWGNRNQVAVAINGYYFNPTSGIPQQGQVHSGWYALRFDDFQDSSGFVWKLDRKAFIGGCIDHKNKEQFISYSDGLTTQEIDDINVPMQTDQLVLYTPQYAASTPASNSGVEVLVEMQRPTLILPKPNSVSGFIRQIHNNQGSTLIPFDHMVISASGAAAEVVKQHAHLGDEIKISQSLAHYEGSDCSTKRNQDDWTKTFASVGADFHFLRSTNIQEINDPGAVVRAPRTAVAYNDQYIFFIVVDGRLPPISYGMTIYELAMFAKDILGASDGVSLDGGGSSTMVVNGKVVNFPSDGAPEITGTPEPEFPQPRHLEMAFSTPAIQLQPAQSEHVYLPVIKRIGDMPIVERYVANGLMMVVVLPKNQSNQFDEGDPVKVNDPQGAELRLGPGSNYSVFGNLAPGQQGTIALHMNGINGVLAKGSYWWKVNMNGKVGWVKEESLSAANP
jgi:hypothetical protein